MIKSQFVEITDNEYLRDIPYGHRIFTSLEGENPGGSIKDHMVKMQLQLWMEQKIISRGSWISELSSGSTAISLAYYAKELQLNCALFLPSTALEKIKQLMSDHNVQPILLNPESAYADYNIESTARGYVQFNQLFDLNKRSFYHNLGFQIKHFYPNINLVIGATGTGHSLLGVCEGVSQTSQVRPWLVSAEPSGNIKIQGCRNLELERYGEQDSLTAADLNQRLLLHSVKDLWPHEFIDTNKGLMQINQSFQLVLGVLRPLLKVRRHMQVFAVGSANKMLYVPAQKITA